MSQAIFPDHLNGLAFTVVRQSEMRTLVQTSPSLVEARVQQAAQPIYHWTLIYEWLMNDIPVGANIKSYAPWSDYEELSSFWLARAGQFDSFLFRDTSQRQNGLVAYYGPGINVSAATVAPDMPNNPPLSTGTPNIAGTVGYRPAKLQLVQGVDSNWYSPIQIWRGGQFWEDILDIDGSLYVYADGALQSSSSYTFVAGIVTPTFSSNALTISWGASAPTEPITAQFHYFHRVRFESDQQDFEQFMQELWTIGGNEAKQGSGTIKLRTDKHPQGIGTTLPTCESNLLPTFGADGFGWTYTGSLIPG